jgi:hypothetical protein
MSAQRLALVVAVDRYQNPALDQLASPAADADALAGVLGDPDLGGFAVEVARNESSVRICERVEGLLADRNPAELALLHFSCHGLKDDHGELYLAAANTAPNRLASTAVDAAWVSRLIRRSRAGRWCCCWTAAMGARSSGEPWCARAARSMLGSGSGRGTWAAGVAEW